MRRSSVTAVLALAVTAALAACSTARTDGGNATAVASGQNSLRPAPAAGGVMRRGDSFAMMSQQYTPRPTTLSATGASAWVKAAPAPAFVASGPPPPADAPAPPPAAVANRQPAAPAAPASEIARPEAAQPAAPAAPAASPALRTAGRALFNNYSCSACHVFADAGASGAVGPSLDNNPRLTRAHSVDVITNGQGPMPAFAGQLTDAEIGTLADYLVAFARK